MVKLATGAVVVAKRRAAFQQRSKNFYPLKNMGLYVFLAVVKIIGTNFGSLRENQLELSFQR